jgi:hypothetical protein
MGLLDIDSGVTEGFDSGQVVREHIRVLVILRGDVPGDRIGERDWMATAEGDLEDIPRRLLEVFKLIQGLRSARSHLS